MKHDWFLQLLGDPFDLNRLAEPFASTSPVSITNEGDQWRLRDETLTEIEDAETVRTELEATLGRLNALARLQWGTDYDGARSGGVGEANAAGGVTWYDSATIVGRSRLSVAATVIGPDGEVRPPPPSPLPRQLHLAITEPDVDDALYYLQRSDPSWTELYKAYEIVRSDIGEVAGTSWASQGELTRFTRTANHQAAAGRDARHARMQAQPPTDPMPLDEGRGLIRRVVATWIAAKVSPTV